LLQLLQERRHAGLIFGVVGGAGYDHANAPHPLGLSAGKQPLRVTV